MSKKKDEKDNKLRSSRKKLRDCNEAHFTFNQVN